MPELDEVKRHENVNLQKIQSSIIKINNVRIQLKEPQPKLKLMQRLPNGTLQEVTGGAPNVTL